MKTYSNYTQMSKERFNAWTKKYEKVFPEYENHPREDYHLTSTKYPILVVADGVTLKRNSEGAYPMPSSAYEFAKVFCEKIIEEAERMYDEFSKEKLKELFLIGNIIAKEFNESQGRTKELIDYREFDFFAATTAFVLIKENTAYWWSLGDSGITAFDSEGNIKFKSPTAWPDEKEKIATTGNLRLTDTEFNKLMKKLFRNAVDENGEKTGYGVLTGEENAFLYLNTGSFTVSKEDLILLYTDGYENYISVPEFLDIFRNWKDTIDVDFNAFIVKKGQENSDLYGREKTLIAVKV
ncbi:MAG: protein phosphatase 2C domain-containing protein [bacterium]